MSAFTSVVSNKANLTCTTGVEEEKPVVLFHNQLHPMVTNSGPYLQFAHKATVEPNHAKKSDDAEEPEDAEKPTNQDPLTNLENEDYKSALIEALEIEEVVFDGHLTTLKEAIDAANTTLDAAKEANESKKAVENAKKAANGAKYDAFVVFFRAIISDEDKLTKFLAMTKEDLDDSAKCTVYYSFFKFIFASIVDAYKAAPVVDGKKKVTPFTYGTVVSAITAADLPLKSKKAAKSDEDEEDNEDEKDEDKDSKKQKHRKPTLYARVLKWIITLDIIENRITPAHINDLKKQKNRKGEWPAYNIIHIRSIYGLAPATKKKLPQPPKTKPLGITLKQSEIKALEAAAAKAKEDQKKAKADAAAKRAAAAKGSKDGKPKGGKPNGRRTSKNQAAAPEGEKKKNNNQRRNKRKAKKTKKDPKAEEEKKEEEEADEPAAPEADEPAEEADDAAKEEKAADAEGSDDDEDSDDEDDED